MKYGFLLLCFLLSTSYAASYTYSCKTTGAYCSSVSGFCGGGILNVLETKASYAAINTPTDPDGTKGTIHYVSEAFDGSGGDVQLSCTFVTPYYNEVSYQFTPEECIGKSPNCSQTDNGPVVCYCD